MRKGVQKQAEVLTNPHLRKAGIQLEFTQTETSVTVIPALQLPWDCCGLQASVYSSSIWCCFLL